MMLLPQNQIYDPREDTVKAAKEHDEIPCEISWWSLQDKKEKKENAARPRANWPQEPRHHKKKENEVIFLCFMYS